MPAPGGDELATKRPISSDEMGKWVRMLLVRHGADLQGRKISSHSCKSTMLSYMAKFGCDITTREILGGHVSHLKSVLMYSRDALAGPLRELEKVLLSIRQQQFNPMRRGLAGSQKFARSRTTSPTTAVQHLTSFKRLKLEKRCCRRLRLEQRRCK